MLHLIETIVGTGVMRAKGKEIGPVRYRLQVFQDGPHGLKECRGTLAADAMHISAAFEAGESEIVRDDTGFAMRFIVTRHSFDGSAEILVNGSPHAT